MDNNKKRTEKKLTASVSAVVILSLALLITTFALLYSAVSVDNNLFKTGGVKINLNDGKPVIEEHEFLLEPGMEIKKEFFIENQSTWDVYYKIYFENIDGGLADVLDVKINAGDKVLFSGKASQLTKANTDAADDILKLNERRELTVIFGCPEEVKNNIENTYLSFDLSADAVQTKNNPDKLFK